MAPPERRLITGEDRDSRSETSIPMTPETPVLPARLRDRLNIRNRRPSSLITPCSLFLLVLLFLRVLVSVLLTPNILEGFMFAFVALLPTVIVGWFVLTRFRDELVNRPFLLMQFLLAAIPLILIVVPVELLISALSSFPIIIDIVSRMGDKLQDLLAQLQTAGEAGDQQKFVEIFQDFIKEAMTTVSLPALIMTMLLVAYFSAGMVEEIGKWLVSRRFLGLECICGHDNRRVGCRGILASACMAGLGFATTENIGYVMAMSRVASITGSTGLLVFLGLFRGAVALPVHVGTQLYVAVVAAQRYVFLDDVKVSTALFQAILFHGTFDAIAFISTFLVGTKRIPVWVGFLVPVADIIMVSLLLLVCRARYKALLERERVALVSEPV